MKKILMALTLLLLVGCSLKMTTYTTIKYSDLIKKMDNKETFIIYFGSSNCSHCKAFKPVLEKVITDYQVKVYYLNIVDFDEDRLEELTSKTNFPQTTPTILFIKDGVTDWNSGFNMINGAKDEAYVIEKFTQNGYIK